MGWPQMYQVTWDIELKASISANHNKAKAVTFPSLVVKQ
jgi:hypothetical protein